MNNDSKRYVYLSRENVEDCMRCVGYSNEEIETKFTNFTPKIYDRLNRIILSETETLVVNDILNEKHI